MQAMPSIVEADAAITPLAMLKWAGCLLTTPWFRLRRRGVVAPHEHLWHRAQLLMRRGR